MPPAPLSIAATTTSQCTHASRANESCASGAAHFDALDSVRGMAFLLVLFSHIGNERHLITRGLGQFGVWIFFALSAFLLSHPFFAAPASSRCPSVWGVYLLRRFFRIVPPLAAALVAFHFFRGWTWESVFANLAFTRGDNVIWTVFVEVRYYLVLPFVVFLVLRCADRHWLGAILLSAMLGLCLWSAPFWSDASHWRVNTFGQGRELALLQYLPVFVAGTIVAYFHATVTSAPKRLSFLARHAAVAFGAALALLVIFAPSTMSAFSSAEVPLTYYHGCWVPLLPLTCMLAFVPLLLRGIPYQIITHPIFRFFGKISYSGYLLHMLLVEHLRGIANVWLYVIATAIGSILMATACHFAIERPFMALARNMCPSQPRRPAVPPGSDSSMS